MVFLGGSGPGGHRFWVGNHEPGRCDGENSDRATHVLQVEFTECGRRKFWVILDLVEDLARDHDRTGYRESFDTSGNVDPVAVYAVLVSDDVADVESDSDGDRRLLLECLLRRDSGRNAVDGASEDAERPVAVELNDLTAVFFDRLAEGVAMPVTDALGPVLVVLHQGREAHHVRKHDGRKLSHRSCPQG